jgi:hypothetical protein
MFRNVMIAALGSAAIAVANPILAAPPGGGGGNPGGGNAGGHMGGNVNVGAMGGPSQSGIDARINSMGPANASPTGVSHSSPNSVLNGSGTTGTRIRAQNSMGPSNASPTGVTHSNARSVLHGTTTVTTPTTRATSSQGLFHANPNGIAHANSRSVLARGAVAPTALPGLATNMTVQTRAGTTLGTVRQVVTDSSGNIRLVIVTNTATGQTYRLAPSSLSISGGVATTTSM